MKSFGLIGRSLQHSFSKDYFDKKFIKEKIQDCEYALFELSKIEEIKFLTQNNPQLRGLNVTIPYKESVIPFLDEIDAESKEIGAVNTIKILNGKLKGYNTDVIGFRNSIKPFLENIHTRALILGSGGASKAIANVLKKLGIQVLFVSRNPKGDHQISYADINEYVIKHHLLIINTTPLGTFPNVEEMPTLPYHLLTPQHFLYDLVYNPTETQFLKKGKEKGAICINGEQMLKIQAEEAWKIWNA